ncbi:MAG: hypothetical protein NW224_07120 [Leptolyngbyaceae cyanobacterium bins.302]|nr:hypothetical protein [Leptolyngbyaceae cyanobacterium bins.302]
MALIHHAIATESVYQADRHSLESDLLDSSLPELRAMGVTAVALKLVG